MFTTKDENAYKGKEAVTWSGPEGAALTSQHDNRIPSTVLISFFVAVSEYHRLDDKQTTKVYPAHSCGK